MNKLTINNTATQLNAATSVTPFIAGREAVVVGTAALVIQGSPDNVVAYTTVATIGADGYANIPALPNWIKVSTAANATLLGGV